MADIVIRPSMKFIKAGYLLVVLVIAGAAVVHYEFLADKYPTPWLPIASVLLLIWPLKHHVQRFSEKLTLSGDKLRYETGIGSKQTRLIQLSKVQDVRVTQSLTQRMFGVGTIAIETAGEASRLVVDNLDNPRQLAEEITNASSHASSTGLH